MQNKPLVHVFNGIDMISCDYTSWVFPGGELGFKFDPESVTRIQMISNQQDNCDNNIGVCVDLFGAVTSDTIQMLWHIPSAVENIIGRNIYDFELNSDYLPFARQDRVCHPGESFALEVFLRQLKAIGVTHVNSCDIHNKKAVNDILGKLNESGKKLRCFEIEQVHCANSATAYGNNHFDFIVAPDKGAMEKAKEFLPTVPHVFLSKTRVDRRVVYDDLTPGTLSGRVLVLDDLGDGCSTFAALAEMLKRTQPDITELSLYVTHGIFSGNYKQNLVAYDKVFCYNVMNEDVLTNPKFIRN